MPRHHRRFLSSSSDDDHGACESWYSCASPPSPAPWYTPPPSPAPSPAPSAYWKYPIPHPIPYLPPAPSPARHPAAGRRNQGGTANGYAPPPPPVHAPDAHHRRFVTNVLAASTALVFLSLILLGVSVAVRRRNLRRQQRRQALLAPAPAATITNVGNDDPEGGGGGGVIHHVWYIRTMGLEQAAIDSIAAMRYRAGGLLGAAADCSVCLGEFGDGELVRLLPRCGHAFHVPCIDTWLRAHVNCPLCRSDVIDAAAAAESGADSGFSAPAADPDANDVTAAEQVAVAIDDSSTPEHDEDEDSDQQEQHVAEEDQQLSSPEPLPQLPCPLPRNVRRAASMDAATVSTAADVVALDRLPEAAPEGEQSDREKDLTGADGHTTTSIERLASGGPPRFFFSRHCRARSSVLPL